MKAPRGKPVVIEGLEFHTCGKGLVHIFPQAATPVLMALASLELDTSVCMLVMRDSDSLTATIYSAGVFGKEIVFHELRPKSQGTVRQLLKREPEVVQDVVLGCMLEFAGEFAGLISAALSHSMRLATGALVQHVMKDLQQQKKQEKAGS